MSIKGLEGLIQSEIKYELQNGAKFVVYEYCISIFIMTFKKSSNVYFIKKDTSLFVKGVPYTIISLIFGWWGIPWGPIHTISSVFTNLKGGKDITAEMLNAFKKVELNI